jgi:hypothetical protein
VRRLLAAARERLYFRKCRGCDAAEFHTHHLTRRGLARLDRIANPRPAWRFWQFLQWVMVGFAVLDVGLATFGHRPFEFIVAAACIAAAFVYRRFDADELRRRSQ